MINVENIKKFKTENKTVLIRFDLNVPLASGLPVSDRIIRVIDSIAELKLLNSKIVILSHLGRPKGKIDNKLSLKQITPQLEQAFDSKITFLDNCIGIDVENKIKNADQNEIILLENCRFYKEEEDNDNNFAQSLAKLADVYINDAFACSHRSHASVAAITSYLPSYCGNLLSEELLNLAEVIEMPLSPSVTIMGGSKISTKISILKSLSIKMDTIIIVGGMANNFIKYSGLNVQDSLIENDVDNLINQIYKFAEDNNCKIITPIDVITAKEVKKDIETVTSAIDEIKENNMILDIGPQTIELIKKELSSAKTVFWNGPAGVFEIPPFQVGTLEIAKYIADLSTKNLIKSFAGGGDTIAALEMANVKNEFSYISTGGGALLELLEGRKLPGLKALNIL
jgi:phosphoglycerate kinase